MDMKREAVVKRLRYTGAEGESACMGAALGPDWHSSFDIQGPAGEAKPAVTVEYETEVLSIIPKDSEGMYWTAFCLLKKSGELRV